jgi:hypothetical protein
LANICWNEATGISLIFPSSPSSQVPLPITHTYIFLLAIIWSTIIALIWSSMRELPMLWTSRDKLELHIAIKAMLVVGDPPIPSWVHSYLEILRCILVIQRYNSSLRMMPITSLKCELLSSLEPSLYDTEEILNRVLLLVTFPRFQSMWSLIRHWMFSFLGQNQNDKYYKSCYWWESSNC